MTGYQEILTDPSLLPADRHADLSAHRQQRRATPRTSNPSSVYAAGLVIRDLPRRRVELAQRRIARRDYLRRENIVAIADIDTRRLTRLLREQRRAERLHSIAPATPIDAEVRRCERRARASPGMAGMDLAKVVSVREPYDWSEPSGRSAAATARRRRPASTSSPTTTASSATSCACSPTAAAASPSCRRRRRPPRCWRCEPDGVFLVQRPRRSRAVRLRDRRDRASSSTRACRRSASASATSCSASPSARSTLKMKFGHHGANHPVHGPRQRPRHASPARTTASRSTRRRCRRTCASRTSRCSTARCRASRAPTGRRSASRAIPEASPGPARHRLPVRPLRRLDGPAQRATNAECLSAPTSRPS